MQTKHPERVRFYEINHAEGCTVIETPNSLGVSIEYSTDIKNIKRTYQPLILIRKPTNEPKPLF